MGREISKKEKIDQDKKQNFQNDNQSGKHRSLKHKSHHGFFKRLMVTGFYVGYIPIAPATASCIISIIIWYLLVDFAIVYGIVTLLLIVVGIVCSNSLVQEWGKDPRQIVIDEYATFLIPLYFTPKRLVPLIITFILFRLFDIVKPPPLRHLEKVNAGWGIMLDDLGASVYTTIIIIIVFILFKL